MLLTKNVACVNFVATESKRRAKALEQERDQALQGISLVPYQVMIAVCLHMCASVYSLILS